MAGHRFALIPLVVALSWSCVEQEPYRPTEDDKKIIRENILPKAPDMKFKVNAELEDKAVYLGLDVDRDVIKPGEQFKLTHYWQVKKSLAGWKLFVHINGPEKSGFMNADHTPVGGRYPVAQWKAGEIVRDEQKVTLPGNWKTPKMMVYTGLWKGNLRMKIKGPQDDESRVLAVTLPVEGVKAEDVKPPGTMVAVRTRQPLKVDGKLDEEVWKRGASSGLFVDTMSGGPAPVKTEARVAWDDKHLYVAFQNEDDDVWTSLKQRDDKLWTQEAVELFIDANGDGKDYIELQVNPEGAIFDSYLPEYRKNQNDWNSELIAAVSVDGTLNNREDKDRGWTVEMAIPWKDVKGKGEYARPLPPEVGDSFKINMFRLDMRRKEPQKAAGWSAPLVGDFHKLDRFGTLVFGDEEGKAPEAKAAGAPEVKEAKVQPLTGVQPLPPGVMRMKEMDNVRTIQGNMPKRIPPPAGAETKAK